MGTNAHNILLTRNDCNISVSSFSTFVLFKQQNYSTLINEYYMSSGGTPLPHRLQLINNLFR